MATILAVGMAASGRPPALAVMARADALVARGDFDSALRLADESDSEGNDASRAAAEEIRGAVAAGRDSLSAATDHYMRALQWAERTAISPLIARTFDALATAYILQRELDRCLDLANRMLEKGALADPNRAEYLLSQGLAYAALQNPAAAEQAFDAALPLAEAEQNLKLIAQIHRQKGLWIWRFKRDLPRALHEYDEALAYGRRAKAWRLVTVTLNGYGNPFRSGPTKNLPEALRRYQEGLAIAQREHLRDQIAYLLKNIGDVERQLGDFGRAEPALIQAMQIADKANVQEVRWMARNQLGMLLADRDPVRAERYFAQALDLLEAQQSDVLLDDFRPGALAGELLFSNPYDQFIDFLMARHRPEDAFLVAERERARVFLDTLTAARGSLGYNLPAGFSDAERKILDRIKAAQASLRTDSLSDIDRNALIAHVGRAEAELTQLRLRLAVEGPSLAYARYPKLWTIHELQSTLLHPDEALLSLHLGEQRSVAWLVTRERLQTIALPPRRELDRRVRAALQELRNPLTRNRAALVALSSALKIGAIANMAAKGRLIIVPHAILYDIPFEALLDDSGHFVVERFAVSYAPSASSLAFLRSVPARTSGTATLVAVANPIVGPRRSAATRQIDLAHVNLLAPVPSTAEEVRQIASLFGRYARVLEGARATRSELRSGDLEQATILHFATHGLIDETHPDRSGLVLTANPPRDDGLLQARDIYAMHLNADLVTLSACETALGENVTGEGIIGLTRAFFFAGARSVVASLWDVEDTATSRFMKRFYANLRMGQPIDIALQGAKLDFIRSGGATAAPFYWASFIVSGQARTVIAVPHTSPAIPLAASVAALLVVLLWSYLRIVKVREDVSSGRP